MSQQQQQQQPNDVRRKQPDNDDDYDIEKTFLVRTEDGTDGDNTNNNNNNITSPSKSKVVVMQVSPLLLSLLLKIPGGSNLVDNTIFQSILLIIQNSFNKFDVTSNKFKLILLMLMVFQNSFTVLVARYTQATTPKNEIYDVNHLIMITEITKFVVSCSIEYYVTNYQLYNNIYYYCYIQRQDAIKVSIPAILYLIQTSVLYIALANLSAPIFQVTYQFKLVTTALLSVILLQRSYTIQQWMCLILLSIGVAIVVLGEQKAKPTNTDSNTKPQSLLVGLISVSVASFSSALAGVYFEVVLKKQQTPTPTTPANKSITTTITSNDKEELKNNNNEDDTSSKDDNETKSLLISTTTTSSSTAAAATTVTDRPAPSLWMRNIQLSVFSILLAAAVPYLKQIYYSITGSGTDEATLALLSSNNNNNKSYLHGFTKWVWVLVGLQAGGGLLVAAIMKYADNVLKGLATGVSIVFATFVSSIIFEESTQLSFQFCSGATLILGSVYYFSNPLPSSTVLQRIISLARHRYMFLSTTFIPSSLSNNNNNNINTEDERRQ